jgi:hypothetical protein
MSQIRIWNTTHLVVAAEQWTTTAAAWENAFTAVYQEVQLPGGRPWDGDAAQAALMRTHADRAKVLGAVDTLTGAAAIARGGAAEIDAARSRALSAVAAAQSAGFDVGDDLTVSDTRNYSSPSARTARLQQARGYSRTIWSSAEALAAMDREVAGRLRPTAVGLTGLTFRESPITGPLPAEPPPPPVPTKDYTPKVWAACKLRGADPNKVVRTFYRAPLSAGFRSLPGGDSQLYCGRDNFGFLHIANDHGRQWEDKTGAGPWTGNWRYLADYAIASALAYPETVTYRQENDTFAVTRAIAPTDGDGNVTGPPTWRALVVVSASDGKIITAYPERIK